MILKFRKLKMRKWEILHKDVVQSVESCHMNIRTYVIGPRWGVGVLLPQRSFGTWYFLPFMLDSGALTDSLDFLVWSTLTTLPAQKIIECDIMKILLVFKMPIWTDQDTKNWPSNLSHLMVVTLLMVGISNKFWGSCSWDNWHYLILVQFKQGH